MSKELATELHNKGYKIVKTGSGFKAIVTDKGGSQRKVDVSTVSSNPTVYKAFTPPKARAPTPGWNNPEIVNASNKMFKDRFRKKNEAIAAESPAAEMMRLDTESNPFSKNVAISAGHEINKLGAGIADVSDMAQYGVQSIPDRLLGTNFSDDEFEEMEARKAEQAERDQQYAPFKAAAPGADFLGSTLPYSVSNVASVPARAAGGVINSKLLGSLDKLDKATRGKAGQALDKLAAKKPGGAFDTIKTETFDPFRKRAAQRAAQGKVVAPWRDGIGDDLTGAAVLGAGEGLAHYDMNPITGAASSVAGQTAGTMLRPITNKAPTYWDKDQADIVEKLKDKGFKFAPGMETGSKKHQKFEAGLRGEESMSDRVSQYDSHNEQKLSDAVWDALGMKFDVNAKGFSMRDRVAKHSADLKHQYESIEKRTTGRISPTIKKDLDGMSVKFAEATDPQGMAAHSAITPYINEVNALGSPVRGKNGRFEKQTFPGSKYQDIRQRMKAEQSKQYDLKNTTASNELKVLISKFDEALSNGMKDMSGGSNTIAKEWKGLNEKYALNEMMFDNGIANGFGHINGDKLYNHLLNTDAKRLITGQGSDALKGLQDIALGANMIKNQSGSGLSSTGTVPLMNKGGQTLPQQLLSFPMVDQVPFVYDQVLKAYMEGIGPGSMKWRPTTDGLLNMKRNPKGTTWDPTFFTRPASMGAKTHDKAWNFYNEESNNENK